MSRAICVAAALALAAAPTARARADELDPAVPRTLAITGAASAVWLFSEVAKGTLAYPTCRWCEPLGIDTDVRDALRWDDPGKARAASNAVVVLLPLGLAGADLAMADGNWRRTGEDVLIVAEATAIAGVATQVLKFTTARRRPDAWARGTRQVADDDLSFPSGHTSAAFAIAGAFGTTAKLRGYAAWPWVYGGGFAAATLVGYLRIAGDKHWLGDIVAGAAVGAASGILTPLLLHRKEPPPPDRATVGLSVLPLGVSGTW